MLLPLMYKKDNYQIHTGLNNESIKILNDLNTKKMRKKMNEAQAGEFFSQVSEASGIQGIKTSFENVSVQFNT